MCLTQRICILAAFCFSLNSLAQERLGSIQPMNAQFNFIDYDSALFTLESEVISLGINTVIEEEKDPGFRVVDLFAYDFSLSYRFGAFNFTLLFENFINLNQKEAGLLPIPDSNFAIQHPIGFEHDSPFVLSFGLVFEF